MPRKSRSKKSKKSRKARSKKSSKKSRKARSKKSSKKSRKARSKKSRKARSRSQKGLASYGTMILRAIRALNNPAGLSIQAIKKFVQNKYPQEYLIFDKVFKEVLRDHLVNGYIKPAPGHPKSYTFGSRML